MKDAKNKKTLYAVVSYALVIIPIVLDMARAYFKVYYSRNFQLPIFTFILAILTPIVVSILVFTKISLQKKVPVQFSEIINIAATVVFAVCAVLFYNPFQVLYFISAYPMLTLIFCIQLCSLAYDLFGKRNKPD